MPPKLTQNQKWFFLIGVAVAVVVLVTPVTVTYQKMSRPLSFVFTPGETRIVPLSNTWCQATTLYSGSLVTVATSLYLLQTTPTLTATSNITLTNNDILSSNTYKSWAFYLHPGSNFSITGCVKYANYKVQFLAIKGRSSYDAWVSRPSYATDSGNYYAITFNNLCSNNTANLVTSGLTLASEDDYYFVVYSNINYLVFTLSIKRTEYVPVSGGVVRSCTTTPFSRCSLNILYNSGQTILVQTSPATDGDWSTKINVSTSCEARVWVYAVVEIFMAISVALATLVFVLYIRQDWIKKAIRFFTPRLVPATQAAPTPTYAPPTAALPVEKPPDYKDLLPPPY